MIEASKYHAYGNDFLIVIGGAAAADQRQKLSRAICDPHFGVGADGCVFLNQNGPGRTGFRIFNQDGSEAEMSGNGLRCAAACLHHKQLLSEDEVVFETAVGRRSLQLLATNYPVWTYRAAMGPAHFHSTEVPMRLDMPRERVRDFELKVEGRIVPVTALSVGNPQCVVFLDAPISDGDFSKLGLALATNPIFPEGTNVSFVRVIDRSHLRVRIWERGVGPTHSSGTGCCGAGVAALSRKEVESPVHVQTQTGTQLVEWEEGGEILLTGDATFIAEVRFEWAAQR